MHPGTSSHNISSNLPQLKSESSRYYRILSQCKPFQSRTKLCQSKFDSRFTITKEPWLTKPPDALHPDHLIRIRNRHVRRLRHHRLRHHHRQPHDRRRHGSHQPAQRPGPHPNVQPKQSGRQYVHHHGLPRHGGARHLWALGGIDVVFPGCTVG